MSKHLINKTETWSKESLQGYLLSNNQNLIALEEYPNAIVRKDFTIIDNQVAILSGGGSGHEPAHLGYIGHGMLTSVVCGDLFASPSTAAILAAIRYLGVSNNAGVLMIVKNYTGDRLNFGLAAKRALLEGIQVDWVLVDDDVALVNTDNQQDDSVGRRGLCGAVLIHKIAGALAEQKKSLQEIKKILDGILKGGYLNTIGVSLSGSVKLPGEFAEQRLDESQIEIGLGIHGEAGRHKTELKSSKDLVKSLLSEYLFNKSYLDQSNNVCLMINNLGGLSNLELSLLAKDCFDYLAECKPSIKLRRVYTGTFMTSLNMNGFSLTVLNLEESQSELILSLLDSSTDAPAWPKSYGKDITEFKYTKSNISSVKSSNVVQSTDFIQFSNYKADFVKMIEFFLKTISEDLIDMREHLNKLDSVCGDGDCGNSLANIAENVLKDLEAKKFDFDYPHQIFLHLSDLFENGGGTLCILLSLFMSSAARAFQKKSIDFFKENEQIFWVKIWKQVIENGTKAVQEYGRAKPNQRSIIDPLTSINNYLNDYIISYGSNRVDTNVLLKNLVDVTYKSVQATSSMKPRVGRASYVDSSVIKTPDAGATGISSILNSIYKAYLIFNNA